MKLAMVIDSQRCINCKACMVSCKNANAVPIGQFRNWVKDSVPARPQQSGAAGPSPAHFQPGACMHCDNPTCVAACPSGATYKNHETGEVIIDRSLCIGCGNCIPSCPYGARFKHTALHVADKCDYCANRRAQGLPPACVETCPTKSRVFGDITDSTSEAAQRLDRHPNFIRIENSQTPTGPNMMYVKNTAPVDWTVPAKEPTSMMLLTRWASPIMKIAVGLAFLGAAGSFARSVILPDKEDDDAPEHSEENKGGRHD